MTPQMLFELQSGSQNFKKAGYGGGIDDKLRSIDRFTDGRSRHAGHLTTPDLHAEYVKHLLRCCINPR
jgi:hypothetical protein